MKTARLLALACSLLAAQCAFPPASPDDFAFGIMGDVPYNEREEPSFLAMIERMNAEPLAFVVHVGDTKGTGRCSDELYLRRKAQFERSAHPLVYAPGDNEWTDCRDPANGGYDPLERLARLRAVYFTDASSMGRRRITTEKQSQCAEATAEGCRCGPLPENRLWEHRGVVFVTLHVVGSNNNRGYEAASERDADCRDKANLAWLAHAGEKAHRARALVVLAQANLWWGKTGTFERYREALVALAQALRKPVLYVHGDTHFYRADTPFVDANGAPVANPARLETYGSPFVGWVKVEVDASRPEPFSYYPRLVAIQP
jgi:hypothetical protein